MSLIHKNAKESFKKTSLVKGDRVPGGGTITQVMRELGGNAYYVQWDELSFEEGPYSLEELKSGSVAKRARKTATKKTAAFTYQGTEYFVGMAQQDGTCEVGGEQIDEGQEVFISEYIEGETQQMVCRWHGKDVQQGVVSKVAKTVRLIDTAGHTWLGEYPGEGELCPECGLPAVANDEHAYGPFGDPSNYDPDVFPDWKGATKKTAEEYQGYTNYETWGVGLWMDNEYEHYVRTRTMDAQQLEQYARANFPTDFVGEFGGFDEVNWQELVDTARETKRKMNPVGKKVTIQSGPDAGLTGLVSRKGQGGWFIEIEGMETGPYKVKVASLKVEKTATKKAASFAEQEVIVTVDGEEFKGYVFEDDGGPTVEVHDPEDDPYMVGAPVDVPRENVHLASKVATTNAELVKDAIDAFFLMDLAYDEDDLDRYALNAGNLGNAVGELVQRGFSMASPIVGLITPVSEENLTQIDDILADMAESVGLPKFTKKAARGRSWEGVSEETGAVVRFTIEQSPLGWLLRKFVKTDYWAGDNAFKQTFAEDGNDSVEAARATAQQIIDSGTFNVTHDWYDSL